jgi:NADH-quinone oxidoreductase subunit I
MTNEYELADDSRESLIWTKEQLVVPLLPGMEAPPHPMRLGESETDYYNLGGSGVAGAKAAATPQDASGAEAAAVQETIGKPANQPSDGDQS